MRDVSSVPLSGRYLSLAEREEIALMRVRRAGVREFARRLCRSSSTISRELRRNVASRGGQLDYRATAAQWHADRRAKRPKTAKLAANDLLRQYVQDRLDGRIVRPDGKPAAAPDVKTWKGRRHGRRADRRCATAWSPEQITGRLRVVFPDADTTCVPLQAIYPAAAPDVKTRKGRRHGRRADLRCATAWSPEQIAGRLRVDFPDDESMRVSHEAIYQALYIQGRGALRRELTACLRTGRALRVP